MITRRWTLRSLYVVLIAAGVLVAGFGVTYFGRGGGTVIAVSLALGAALAVFGLFLLWRSRRF